MRSVGLKQTMGWGLQSWTTIFWTYTIYILLNNDAVFSSSGHVVLTWCCSEKEVPHAQRSVIQSSHLVFFYIYSSEFIFYLEDINLRELKCESKIEAGAGPKWRLRLRNPACTALQLPKNNLKNQVIFAKR